MNIHETYINRCIEIAKNGLGSTQPNPMVGCVIVYNNTIIGEGFTSTYGGNHAEVNALHKVKDKTLLSKATLYVSLEPCSHYGKTPPCCNLIIQYKIPKVVIGCKDTSKDVAGKGIEALQLAGCEVIVGVLEEKCRIHHKRFFSFHDKKRPYIILKWAKSQDGFIAPNNKTNKNPVWITNATSRVLVHKWRSEEQAILVGYNTVIEDNPSLTTRNFYGKNPIRIVIDPYSQLSKSANVFNNLAKTILITKNEVDFTKNFAQHICSLLHQNSITSVIIEGGTKILNAFINEDLWDEARVFTGPIIFKNGIKAPLLKGHIISETLIDTDVLKIYNHD